MCPTAAAPPAGAFASKQQSRKGPSVIETDQVLSLRLPAEARFIRMARLVGAGLANELGIDLAGLDDVRLAIGEACALAARSGVGHLDLQFALGEDHLVVSGQGTPGNGPFAFDEDHAALVRHILDVACADHGVAADADGLSFTLTFVHGS